MDQFSKTKIGLRFGVPTGIVYMLVLVGRYKFGETQAQLVIGSIVGYAIVVLLFFLAAVARKKQLGGFASLRELFGTIFIVILITEFCFAVFNIVYLRYIDPGYLERFGRQTLAWMQQSNVPEKELETFRQALQEQKQVGIGTLVFGFAQAVIVDSVLGLIIAFILKKNKPV